MVCSMISDRNIFVAQMDALSAQMHRCAQCTDALSAHIRADGASEDMHIAANFHTERGFS